MLSFLWPARGATIISWFVFFFPLPQGVATFSIKRQIVHILGVMSNSISVITTHRYCCSMKAFTDNNRNKSSYIPVRDALWTWKFVFHVIFRSHEILFFFCYFSQPFNNIKKKKLFLAHGSPKKKKIQMMDHIWPTDCCLAHLIY